MHLGLCLPRTHTSLPCPSPTSGKWEEAFILWSDKWPVQFSHSVVSNSVTHGLQHAMPPCPSPTPGAYSNSCPLSRWCHPIISSSVVPFSSHLHSFQHQGLFKWVGSSHQVAKLLEFQLQHQSFQRIFRIDFLQDGLLGSPHSPRDSQNKWWLQANPRLKRSLAFHLPARFLRHVWDTGQLCCVNSGYQALAVKVVRFSKLNYRHQLNLHFR